MRNALIGILLSCCCSCSAWSSLFRRPPRPVRAPPQEALQLLLPTDVPEEGRRIVNGKMVKAIQVAMEDFLPWDWVLPPDSSPKDQCLAKRDSYLVMAAPKDKHVMFVSIALEPEACTKPGDPPILDMGKLYAIDTDDWRILASAPP